MLLDVVRQVSQLAHVAVGVDLRDDWLVQVCRVGSLRAIHLLVLLVVDLRRGPRREVLVVERRAVLLVLIIATLCIFVLIHGTDKWLLLHPLAEFSVYTSAEMVLLIGHQLSGDST